MFQEHFLTSVPAPSPPHPPFLGLYLFIFLLVKCLSSLNLFSRHFHGHNEAICSHSNVGILFCLFLYFTQSDTTSKSREAQTSSKCTSSLKSSCGKPGVKVTCETSDRRESWRSMSSEILRNLTVYGELRGDWETWSDAPHREMVLLARG